MSIGAQIAISSSQHGELIRSIKELNATQKAVLSAINDLPDMLNDSEIFSPGLKERTNASQTSVPTFNAVASSDLPTREHGYVNWNSTHEVLKSQKWNRANAYTEYCGRIERTSARQLHSASVPSSGKFGVVKYTVNEDERFPEDGLYVNVNSPQVAAEILYISEIRFTDEECQKNNKTGIVVSHFLKEVKNHMHTRSSFEEYYGLKWIDRKA